MQARLGQEAKRETLVAASKASSRRQTYEGIDKCALCSRSFSNCSSNTVAPPTTGVMTSMTSYALQYKGRHVPNVLHQWPIVGACSARSACCAGNAAIPRAVWLALKI